MDNAIHSSYQFDSLYFRHEVSPDFISSYTLHHHDIPEMLFIKQGDINYTVEGKLYHLSKNCLVLSRAFEMHAIRANLPATYERYDILFDINQFASPVCRNLPNHVDMINFNGNEMVCGLFKKMDYFCKHFEGDDLKNILMNLTEEVLYHVQIASKEAAPNSICTINPIINQALQYINENITAPLCIESICDELYITKSHLHHLFIKHLNISPKKYILSKKLNLAQKQLRGGDKPTVVSYAYGFSDYSTFYRAYKQFFGHTPSEEIGLEMIREIIF